MVDLDRQETYARLDPSGLGGRIAGLPEQCKQAWEQASGLDLPAKYSKVSHIVVIGMGGSAIGGDLLAGLLELEDAPPVQVIRGYQLPSWIGSNTLVLASSYSGNTEETLSAYREARLRGACLVAMTSGGILAKEAAANETPLLHIGYQGEPRSAVGYSFLGPLAILCSLRLIEDATLPLRKALEQLQGFSETLGSAVTRERNLAKRLASANFGRFPVVYGAGFLTAAARRWKTQLNENGKVWASYEPLPEVHHNAVLGYSKPTELRGRMHVTLLHSDLIHPRVSLRYQITREILSREGVDYMQVDGVGGTPLAHLLSTVLLGDYASYYLGILNGMDPVQATTIEELKKRLAEG